MLTIRQIQHKVAKYFNVSIESMLGKSQKEHTTTPRQVSIYLCRLAGYRAHEVNKLHKRSQGYYSSTYRINMLIDSDKILRNKVNQLIDICKIKESPKQKDLKKAIIRDLISASDRLTTGNVSHTKGTLRQIAISISML